MSNIQSQSSGQYQRWVLTYHGFQSSFELGAIASYLQRPEFKVKRAVCGREFATNSEIPHLQGYIELVRSYRRTHVLNIFRNAYWEGARGSAADNYRYCTKGI